MRPMPATTNLRRRLVALLFAIAITVAGARTAQAQLLEAPRARQGYYVSVGYHLVLNKNWEDKESWGVWPGTDLSIRIGQMLTRRLGLGLNIHFGGSSGEGQSASLGGLSLEGQFEVARNLALFGGAGLDVVSIASDDGTDDVLRGTVGAGYFLGLGYDWFFTRRLTGGWAATPTLQARVVPGTNVSAFIGLIGVQLSYFTGLPRNQLDLPPEEAFKRQ